MTKKQHIVAEQQKPCGIEGLAQIRAIVANHQYAKVNETAVDAWSAQIIVKIHDALNEENQAKLLRFPVWRVADICLKLANKHAR